MKQTIIFAFLVLSAEAAKTGAKLKNNGPTPGEDPKAGELGSVMTPQFLTALITTFFLYWMLTFGFNQLMDIQTPPYQLKYDSRNKDNNRDWSRIWGNIEK